MTDKIVFNGTHFQIIENNQITFEVAAISGKLGHQNPVEANQSFIGTIPEGIYQVKQSQYQNIENVGNLNYLWGKLFLGGQWMGAEYSWGNERVWLEPTAGTNTYGRSNFSIHGGAAPGSAGCIDLGQDSEWFFNYFKNSNKDWTLEVDYGNYNGSSHPLLNNGYQQHEIKAYDFDLKKAVEGNGGAVSNDDVAVSNSGSVTVSVAKVSANTNINGNSYSITQIGDSLQKAGQALGEFVVKQAEDGLAWFSDANNGAGIAFASWLGQNLQDLVDGEMTSEEAFIDLAKFLAVSFVSQQLADSVTNNETAREAMSAVFETLGVTNTDPYVDSMYAALFQMGIQFATSDTADWTSSDYINAGVLTISSSLARVYVQQNYGVSGSEAGAIVAATVALINGLSDTQGYGQTEWIMVGVNVGVAAAVAWAGIEAGAYAGAKLGALIGSSIAPGVGTAIGIVVGAILGIVAGDSIKNIYQGQVFYNGEYGDPSLVLNSIYQVQTIMVNGVPTQAVVGVNPQGSTILVSGITHAIGTGNADVLVDNTGLNNYFTGNGGSDYLEGRVGDDVLIGLDESDHINGGVGNDVLQGDSGNDLLFGEEGTDTLIGGIDDDFMHGGSDDDIMTGGAGGDNMLGGGGNDAMAGDAGDDMIDGGYGDDGISGGDGNDTILGNLGNDSITGDAGSDSIFGDEGNDTIYGNDGNDFIDGGAGVDLLYGDNGQDYIVGNLGDDFIEGGLEDDSLLGGAGNDTILGGMDDDYIFGEDGDDILKGGFGNDILKGGLGVDVLEGETGDDVYVFNNQATDINNIIEDTGGNDSIFLQWGEVAFTNSHLQLNKVGNNLEIYHQARKVATINNHFTNENKIERIDISNNFHVDLSAVTYDSNTGEGYINFINSGPSQNASEIGRREKFVSDNQQTQQLYWNDTFLDKLSQIAYDEQLGEQTSYTYYNGSQVQSFFRNRGKFGGKYTVYKLDVAGNMNGTEAAYNFTNITPNSDVSSYDSVFLNAQKVVSNASYPGVSMQYTDFWQGTQHLLSLLVVSSSSGTFSYELNPSDVSTVQVGYTEYQWDAYQRKANIASTTVSVGMTITGGDKLVGGYWDEVIDGKSGDDVLVGNEGNDTIIGGLGDDWLFAGNGNDILTGGDNNDVLFGSDGDDNLNGGTGDDAIIGGIGNDTIIADIGNDWIDGEKGADNINAGDGNDILFGGDDDDVLTGGAGADIIHGDEGNDSIEGGDGNDIIYGGGGYDWINGGAGNDTIDGGSGLSSVDGGGGTDRLSYKSSTAGMNLNLNQIFNSQTTGDIFLSVEEFGGTDYNDTIDGFTSEKNIIYGYKGNDLINGGSNDDNLSGNEGNDTIYGNNNNDVIEGGAGADTLDGGAGFDSISYRNSFAAVVVNLSNNSVSSADAQGDIISNFEAIIGSAYSDTLTGNSSNNHIYGEDGHDTLQGGAGADIINGGNGIDAASYSVSSGGVTANILTNVNTGADAQGDVFSNIENLAGSSFNDNLTGDNRDNFLWGNAGNDILNGGGENDMLYGGAGADTIDGGIGIDSVNYDISSSAVTVNLSTGTGTGGDAQGDIITNVERIIGSQFNDILTGDSGDNYLFGQQGNDTLNGGDGNDMLDGELGADTINGGNGVDTIVYAWSNAAITVNLSNNTISGGSAQGDVISNIENVSGSNYNDNITGSSGDNYLWGNAGNDTINSGDGNDTIEGGAGADTINGGAGTDTVSYALSTLGVNINLETNINTGGDAQGDNLTNIENIRATSVNDTIRGNSLANYIIAAGGNDIIIGGAGADTIDGGDEIDTISYINSSGGVTVNLVTNINTGADAQGDFLTNIENITGSLYNDTLTGNSGMNVINGDNGNDIIDGGDGNDTIVGGAGADAINGGAGTDIVSYALSSLGVNINLETNIHSGGDAQGDNLTNIENIRATSVNDTIRGNSLANYIIAAGGNDIIIGGAGADTIDGGDEIDTISYINSSGFVTVNLVTNINTGGDAQGDFLTNIENITGSVFNDILTGNSATNVINGDSGDDTIVGGAGADTIDGGSGTDMVNYADSATAVNINLETNIHSGGDAQGDNLTNIENIRATSWSDTIRGNSLANYIFAAGGDDSIIGGFGADTIDGGDDIDTISYINSSAAVTVNLTTNVNTGADAQGDLLSNIENITGSLYNDILTGNSAANIINGDNEDDYIEGGAGADILNGGAGYDKISYSMSSAGVIVDLSNNTVSGGDAQGDVISNFESIIGSNYIDNLTGNNGDNFIWGEAGDDILNGGLGADVLVGGDGFDTVIYWYSSSVNINLQTNIATGGEAQGDSLVGVEAISGSNYNDIITGYTSVGNFLWGGNGNDTLNGGENVDQIHGNANDDIIYGLGNSDTLNGNEGNDTIYGGTGADIISGNEGNDSLFGDSENDTIYGGIGNDTINGGTGKDFIFGEDGDDVLNGSSSGQDELNGGAGADVFVFTSLTHSTASLRDVIQDFSQGIDKIKLTGLASSISEFSFSQSGGNTFVNDLDSTFGFQLNGLYNLASSDFIFS